MVYRQCDFFIIKLIFFANFDIVSSTKSDQKINSLPLDTSLHPSILFSTTEIILYYIPLKKTVLYALVAIVETTLVLYPLCSGNFASSIYVKGEHNL